MLGLFKHECEGSQMIALCPKCHYVDEQDSETTKVSKTGMLKIENNVTWQCFKGALNGNIDGAENRRFHMVNGRMANYEQQKLGLSACSKRWVLPDGIRTEPIDFERT